MVFKNKRTKMIDKWANFLANEKLTPKRVGNHLLLIKLCEALAEKRSPLIRPYREKLNSRRLVCETAIELGIDLTSLKCKNKMAIGRGLLESWKEVYEQTFGSSFGTAAEKEIKRRDIKQKERVK